MNIFTKFHKDWTTIVDFFLYSQVFAQSKYFYVHPLLTYFKERYINPNLLDWQWVVIGGGFGISHKKTAFFMKSKRILSLMTSYRTMIPSRKKNTHKRISISLPICVVHDPFFGYSYLLLPVEREIEVDGQLIVYAMIRYHVFNHWKKTIRNENYILVWYWALPCKKNQSK